MIAVVSQDDVAGSRYTEEILAQAGLVWERRSVDALASGPPPVVLVLAGEGRLRADEAGFVTGAVREGMALVTTGGTWGLDDLLGAIPVTGGGEGFITELASAHPVTKGFESSLHVFAGTGLQPTTGETIASLLGPNRETPIGAAVVVRRVGRGATMAIGPNIPASVLHIQLGIAIDKDGEPAPDGTAPIDEGILKTDDGVVLDWKHDRIQSPIDESVPECPGKHESYPAGDTPWFGLPIADELRAILLNAIHWAAASSGHLLPVLAAWPRELPAVGLISHDSDGNLNAGAHSTLRVLEEAQITSTWCHMWGPTSPNVYDPATFPLIHAAGHEFALHYNSVQHDGGTWGRDHFETQYEFVRNEAGVDGFVSNKNHYLRWEGKVDFFYWLVDKGIQADQCKGPSKKGNVGYPHGSTLPWFPLDTEAGSYIDVLEIPLQFQDLWLTAPEYLNRHTIRQAVKHHGVAHFLFHQVHIHTRPEVAAALLRTVELGREQGLEWWTSARINDWQRLRRQICLRVEGDKLVVTSPQVVTGATIVLPLPEGSPTSGTTTHANLPATTIVTDLAAGETVIDLPALTKA